MRAKLIRLIRREVSNIKKGKSAGIAIKVNSIEDQATIDELYKASKAGVEVRLMVRGICCLRPGRESLSENITVKSIVGDYLEHSRIYYFHNGGKATVYGGSADMMNRSFDRRIESLFLVDGFQQQQMINILDYSWKDTSNSCYLQENGDYEPSKGKKRFNIHKEFYKVDEQKVLEAKLFE
jgi:polyphosphate kinase